jgi:integral membrane sensor domain MASE1
VFEKQNHGVLFPLGYLNRWWSRGVTLAVATGIAYFLAARLGLALRDEPGMAVFWPAAGIAVGALTALGPRTRVPVTVSVFFASAACSLMIGRNAWLSISFAFLNTGQPLLTAGLLEHWFGRTIKLEDVQRVLGFFAATAVGCATAAVGAAVVISLIKPTASPLHVSGLWFAAGLTGGCHGRPTADRTGRCYA